MTKTVLVTGGFDPIHSGHIAYLRAARDLGQRLVVGLNSDAWLTKKKGQHFMPWKERCAVLAAMSMVDSVIAFDDSDGSACDALRSLRDMYPEDHLIFANGGDRTTDNIPEIHCGVSDVEFQFAVGGDHKANSSSWILQEWRAPRTARPWGHYRVLHTMGATIKVKELTVEPGQALSMQRHNHRSEFWFVAQGQATVYTLDTSTDLMLVGQFSEHQHVWISNQQWHQLRNEQSHALRIIEIQYGDDCQEHDIQRQIAP